MPWRIGPRHTQRDFRVRLFISSAAGRLEYIQPGNPVQNAYAKSFNGRLRDECLSANWFKFDAIEAWPKSLELYPNERLTLGLMAAAYERKGDDVKAAESYLSVAEVDGTPATELERLRAAIKRDGSKGYWKEQLRLAATNNSGDSYWRAEIYAHLGDRKHTLEYLERGYLEHSRGMARLNMEPLYDFLRSDPRFRAVLSKMAFPN